MTQPEPEPEPDNEVFCLRCHSEIQIQEPRIPALVDGAEGYLHDYCPDPRS
jgi:hypothetical protein